jgi:hypothetical protein
MTKVIGKECVLLILVNLTHHQTLPDSPLIISQPFTVYQNRKTHRTKLEVPIRIETSSLAWKRIRTRTQELFISLFARTFAAFATDL